MSRSRPSVYNNYGKVPSDGFHVLKDVWIQRSYIDGHSRALTEGLHGAILATKSAVQIRAKLAHHFRMHEGRRVFPARADRADERALEHRIFTALGPNAPRATNGFWDQLVAYQIPLFNSSTVKTKWGWVDLLAVTAGFDPVVIELKHADANDTPLRTLLECVANMIAVEANWPRLGREISELPIFAGRQVGTEQKVVAPRGVLLAPASYWTNWDYGGEFAKRINEEARVSFRALRQALAEAGYPTVSAVVRTSGTDLPQIEEMNTGW